MPDRSRLLGALVSATICSITTGAWAQTLVSFSAAPSFYAGTSPTSVARADLNGDSYPDLVVSNQKGISTLINDGKGGFLPRADYFLPSGTNPVWVETFDLNGTGRGIAVVCEGTGSVTIYSSNGTGTLQIGNTYPAGVNPRQVVVDDFNGDKNPDLAIVDSGAAAGTSGVSVLLGNGDGTFQPTKFYPAGATSVALAVGIFNSDSYHDLVVANSGSDDLSILLGNSDGSFQAPLTYPLNEPGITVSPTSVLAAFLNDDSISDVVVLTPSVKGYAVLLGQGDGKLQAPSHYLLDDPNFVNNNDRFYDSAVDVNGDKRFDLIIANYGSDHVTVLYGAGDGTFPKSHIYAAGPSPTCVHYLDSYTDSNLNLVFDFVVSNDQVDGVVTVLHGNADGTLQAAPLYRSAFVPTSLAIGDLNNDGILDIVAAGPIGGPGVAAGVTMLGNGDGAVVGKGGGTFQPPVTWTTTGATSLALGDFNRDGMLDLVSTYLSPGNGHVSVWQGNGDGTFQTPTNLTAGATPSTVVVADVNGDNYLDLVVGNLNSNNISVILGNGDGTFQAPANYPTPATGPPESLVVTDFNGDGKPDIAVAISGVNATSVTLLLGNGNGTFQAPIQIPSGFRSPSTLQIAAADFNGDGMSDLAVTDGTTLSVLLGNGSGTIPTPALDTLIGTGAADSGSIAIADFNGDNVPDIIVTTRDGIFVVLNTAAGLFQGAVNYNPLLGGALAIGDLDGDNRPDIVTADSSQDSISTDTIAVLLNTTPYHTAPLTVATSPAGLSVDVYVGFPPGGIISEYETCGAAPCMYTATWGNFFQIYAAPVLSGAPGTQYTLSSFSDGGSSVADCCGDIIHNVIFPGVASTETVTYRQQFQLTVGAQPVNGGATTPASGNYFDAGASPAITATPNPGYVFTAWNGNAANIGSPSTTVKMNAPQQVTADFTFVAGRCDLVADQQINGADVQAVIRQALGLDPPAADLNSDGSVGVVDIGTVVNAALGGLCPRG